MVSSPSLAPDRPARSSLARAIADRFGVDIGTLDPHKVQALLSALSGPIDEIDEWSARPVAEALARPDAEADRPRTRPGLAALIGERVLLAGPRPLKVWVAGCATGGGPSELATLVEMLRGLPHGARVLGTDRDPVALQDVALAEGDGVECWLRVLDPMRDDVEFEADLVLCSGQLARLRPDRRTELLERLRRALVPGGHLVLGPDDHAPALVGMGTRAVAALPVRSRPRTGAPAEAVRARVHSALGLAKARRSPTAMERLRTWMEEDPAEAAYPTAAAEIALRDGFPRQALRHAERAATLAPDACTPAVLFAEALIVLGDARAEDALASACARVSARLSSAPLPLGLGMTAGTLRLRLQRMTALPQMVEAAG